LGTIKGIELSDGKVTLAYQFEVFLYFTEIRASGTNQDIPRLPGVHDINIVVPPAERKHDTYFGNAFGFTDMTSNGLVQEYTPTYGRFIALKMTLFLRWLNLIWSRSLAPNTRESIDALLDRLISKQELGAAFEAWRTTLLKLCAAYGLDTIYIHTAVHHILQQISRVDISSLFSAILDLHALSSQLNGVDLSGLVDEQYQIGNGANLLWPVILQCCAAIAESRQTELLVEPTHEERADLGQRIEAGPKLLMSVLVENISLVEELYPTEPQQWCLQSTL
jgi:hypothetical protein